MIISFNQTKQKKDQVPKATNLQKKAKLTNPNINISSNNNNQVQQANQSKGNLQKNPNSSKPKKPKSSKSGKKKPKIKNQLSSQQDSSSQTLNQKQQQQAQLKEAQQEEKVVVIGSVTIKYSHYNSQFPIKNGEISYDTIDQLYCLSYVFQGNFKMKLHPENNKQIEVEQQNRIFTNLEDKQTYILSIIEDPEVVQKESKVRYNKFINLKLLVDVIDSIKKCNKTSIIVEEENRAFTFFKYKGNIVDISESGLREKMGKQDRAESVEFARKQMLYSLQSGSCCVFYMEKSLINLKDFFKSAEWFQPDILFDPTLVLDTKFYKKYIVKPEEDYDIFGNKGCFYANEDFTIVLLIGHKLTELEQAVEQIGINSAQFTFIKVKREDECQNEVIFKDKTIASFTRQFQDHGHDFFRAYIKD